MSLHSAPTVDLDLDDPWFQRTQDEVALAPARRPRRGTRVLALWLVVFAVLSVGALLAFAGVTLAAGVSAL